MKGRRGDYPGTFRSSLNRWGMKVWIDGALHYLGGMEDRSAAADYVRLVEGRYPDRLRRRPGTVYRHRRGWVVQGPRPARRYLGLFDTRWAAERALRHFLNPPVLNPPGGLPRAAGRSASPGAG